MPINKRQEVFSNGSLIIHDVQKGVDDGNYTCSVTDGHQVVKKNVRMSINGNNCYFKILLNFILLNIFFF